MFRKNRQVRSLVCPRGEASSLNSNAPCHDCFAFDSSEAVCVSKLYICVLPCPPVPPRPCPIFCFFRVQGDSTLSLQDNIGPGPSCQRRRPAPRPLPFDMGWLGDSGGWAPGGAGAQILAGAFTSLSLSVSLCIYVYCSISFSLYMYMCALPLIQVLRAINRAAFDESGPPPIFIGGTTIELRQKLGP